MNIDSPGLNALFTSSDSLNTSQQLSSVDGSLSQNFADALKDQIKQLTNMKEIAGKLNEEGIESEFSALFGNGLPLFNTQEKDLDVDSTIEALENVLNSLENVTTDEMNLSARLQGLVEKTNVLKAETLDSIELDDKVARLAEELQKIQEIVSQYHEQGNSIVGLTDETGLLETQIDHLTKELDSVKDANFVNEKESSNVLGQAEIDNEAQLASIIPVLNESIEYERASNPVLSDIKPALNKEDATLRLIAEQRALLHAEKTEPDSLLQQENAFRKPGQDNPVLMAKQNEINKLLDEIDLSSNSEKTLPKFAADIAMLNKAVMNENKNTLIPMGKHFAHPEWNKEMGERVLWMHKQAIPTAELKLNPRHLGPITIKVDVTQDQATVAFTAQHAVVKEAIEAAIPKLREMFSAQQLNLTDVNVSQDDSGQRQSKGFSQMENQQGNNKSNKSEIMSENDQDIDLMGITEEIEAGRAIASNGILSVFA